MRTSSISTEFSIQSVFSRFSIYSLGSVFQSFLNFLLIPLYINWLSKAEYGIVVLIQATLFIFMTISQLGMPSAVFRFWSERTASNDDIGKRSCASTGMQAIVLSSFITCGLLNIGISELVQVLPHFAIYELSFRLASLILLSAGIKQLVFLILQAEQLVTKFVTFNLVDVSLGLVGNILAVVVFKTGITGIFIATLIKELIILPFSAIIFARQVGWVKLSTEDLKNMLRYGLPIVPVIAQAWIVELSDRYFVSALASIEILAVYNLGYRIAGITQILLINPMINAWNPIAFSMGFSEQAKKKYAIVQTYLVLGGMAIALCLGASSGPLLKLLTHNVEYWQAQRVVFAVATSYVLYGMYSVLASVIGVSKRTELSAILWFMCAFINVFLNWFLIPKLGMMGAMWSTLISYTIAVIAFFLVSQRIFYVKYEYGRLFRIAIISLGIYLAQNNLPALSKNLWLDLILRGLGTLLLYMGGLALIGFIQPEELIFLKKQFAKLRPKPIC
ncbi:MAG: lipopolysaccharide biosynthesis protein [Clostridiaceae bacterium]